MHLSIFGILMFCPLLLAVPGPWDWLQDLWDLRNNKIQGYFRIEALILSMQNPKGTTRASLPCDFGNEGKCDPTIGATIDYHTPNYNFGKDSVPFKRFAIIHDGAGESDVDINQAVFKDVCNNSTRKINVRVFAKDKDPLPLADDLIDHWSCFIQTNPGPAVDENAAHWSEEQTCVGHNPAHTIKWKYRWYYIPQNECHEVEGSSSIVKRYNPFSQDYLV
ncbi:uncharacterized protein LOC129583362 [Paramacrobiotus metropolitanus]|uniref:uncharacterized protein LOC129583362 n=1 Tax=Paramacrobiotus metropolitanus TaxID=2943436 RepID=UPI002445EB33|nr:uncharacterized protein LOC129583362 [Paramacrobiotus metropolitanus]